MGRLAILGSVRLLHLWYNRCHQSTSSCYAKVQPSFTHFKFYVKSMQRGLGQWHRVRNWQKWWIREIYVSWQSPPKRPHPLQHYEWMMFMYMWMYVQLVFSLHANHLGGGANVSSFSRGGAGCPRVWGDTFLFRLCPTIIIGIFSLFNSQYFNL